MAVESKVFFCPTYSILFQYGIQMNDFRKVLRAFSILFSSVQSLSCVLLLASPWTAARQASLSITNPQSLLKLMSSMLVIMAQLVKNPPAMWDTWLQSLGWDDPLEKRKAVHSSILAQRIPWTV